MNSTPQPPVIVAPPPPPVAIPIAYAAGALLHDQVAMALLQIFPSWTAAQANNEASLLFTAAAGIHMLIAWYVKLKYPNAPPLPDMLRNP